MQGKPLHRHMCTHLRVCRRFAWGLFVGAVGGAYPRMWIGVLLVFRAIMKSNGWSPDTAALQLFAHLDGEALKLALLMPDRIREHWKDLVDELSAYYYTPGRLAVIRRQFENARVGSVMPASNESPRRVMHSSADRELLIRNVLEAVGARRNVNSKRSRSREFELLLRDMPPVGSVTEEKTSPPAVQPARGTPPLTDDLWDCGQCFSCGFHGHGVNRCSQLDISFPYKMPGWSVNVRNGQYRASRMHGDGQDRRRGKEGWSMRTPTDAA